MQRLSTLIFLMFALSFLTACEQFRFPGVFKIDIGQGNILTQEKVAQLAIGMTENQVIYLMGSPMIKDPFNPNEWDYYYSFSPAGETTQTYHLRLFFENKRLKKFKGSVPEQSTPHLFSN